MRQLTKCLNAGKRRRDRHSRELLRGRPALAFENDVHAIIAVKILADKRAARNCPHGSCDRGAVKPGSRNATVVRDKLQFGFGDCETRNWPNLRTRYGLVYDGHCSHSNLGQNIDIRALQVDINCAPAVETEIQHRGSLYKCLGVRQINEYFVADDIDHFGYAIRILRIDVECAKGPECRKVIAANVGLLFMLHVRAQSLHNHIGDFLAHHFDRAARRHAEECVQ